MKRIYPASDVELWKAIGRVKEGTPVQRVVTPEGFVETTFIVLKMYRMREVESKTPSVEDTLNAGEFLTSEIDVGRVKPHSGLGFVIHSHGLLNMCRWSDKYQDVIVPQIYTEKNGIWVPEKVEEAGAFCSGEKAVYDFENRRWLKYLASNRDRGAKINYLAEFFSGKVK